MKYFKALHDFTAADAVELSVKKGDLLCAQERVEQDGWLKVELASDTRRRGFVPVTYVKEVSSSGSSTGSAPLPAAPVATSSSAATQSFTTAALSFGEKVVSTAPPSPMHAAYGLVGGGAGNSSSLQYQPRPQQHQAPSPAPQAAPQEPYVAGNTSTTFLSNPNAVVEAFMKNEVYFKQLMKQRQESLAKIENGIAEALTDITACKDKNSILARKLRDLDVTIEKERKKWKDRVEEEKLLIQRTAANTTQVGSLGIVAAGTTSQSQQFASNSITFQRSVSASSRSAGRQQ